MNPFPIPLTHAPTQPVTFSFVEKGDRAQEEKRGQMVWGFSLEQSRACQLEFQPLVDLKLL